MSHEHTMNSDCMVAIRIIDRGEETPKRVESFCPSGNLTGNECIGEACTGYRLGKT